MIYKPSRFWRGSFLFFFFGLSPLDRVDKLRQFSLLLIGKLFCRRCKAGVYFRFPFSEKFLKTYIQSVTEVGERFHGWISLSQFYFPQVALRYSRQIGQFVYRYSFSFAKVFDSFSNIHNLLLCLPCALNFFVGNKYRNYNYNNKIIINYSYTLDKLS